MLCALQDTQEFLRCLMDQLHEELKEPFIDCSNSITDNDSESNHDNQNHADGDRSPSEDDFLSCDSGSGSERGDGDRAGGETELLIQDECSGARESGGISEKEKLKERRREDQGEERTPEMDEDADVDTAVQEEQNERGGEQMGTSRAQGNTGTHKNRLYIIRYTFVLSCINNN